MTNSVALLIVGVYFLAVGIKGKQSELVALIAEEKGFLWWLLSIALLWGLVVAVVPSKYHGTIVVLVVAMLMLGTGAGGVFMSGVQSLVTWISEEVK